MTQEMIDLITDENYLIGLDLRKDYGLVLILTYLGGDNVQYHCFRNDVLLFEGKDFKPSPLYNQDDLETVIGMLSWLCVGIGDTDEGYFENYTPEQLIWAQTDTREQLSLLISDFEQDYDPEYMEEDYPAQAREYFEKAAIDYVHY